MTLEEPSALVNQLFVAWSSGDPDYVGAHFHAEAALWDSVNGWFRGREAIVGLYRASLERWDDLETHATRFWPADGPCVAFTWTMSGIVADDRFGREYRGRAATFEGMAYITFADGLVMEEIEYFDRAAAARSLGLAIDVLTYRTSHEEAQT